LRGAANFPSSPATQTHPDLTAHRQFYRLRMFMT
jgi:hypothetical protein